MIETADNSSAVFFIKRNPYHCVTKFIVVVFRKFLFLAVLLMPGIVWAQTGLSGLVLDADNKQVIASANVYLSNSSVGTITNEKGEFNIHNFPSGRYDLVISCIGYTTQVITASSAQLPPLLTVLLTPNVKELQEVIVEPFDKNGWEKWGSFFIENFIGTSAFASDCKLLNKDVVKFRHNKKNNTLKAIGTEQLVIENRALGYILKYDLIRFEFDFNSRIFVYEGHPLFEEIETKRTGLQKRWLANREDAYYGSLMHFMRSLYRNKLIEEHFEVRKLIKIPETEKKRIKAIYQARIQYAKGSAGDVMSGLPADTVAYYTKVMRQPESMNILIDKLLTGDSIAYAIDSTTVGLDFTDYLQIIYPPKKTPIEYERTLRRGVLSTAIGSEIFRTNNNPIAVFANGSYFEGTELITSGYWAWSEKMAAMLPNDYWPPPKKK
jgi:hypothetical protein